MARARQDRRREILEAAARVISERGLQETRIADVARAAGVSSGLAVYYFNSKDELLSEALAFAEDRFYRQTMEQLAELHTAREKLVTLVELCCPPRGGGQFEDWALWLELWAGAMRDEQLAAKRIELDQLWRETIAEIVRLGRRNLEFAPVDVDEFVLRLSALIDGLAVQVMLQDPGMDARRMREVVVQAAARELGFDARTADAGAARRDRADGASEPS